MNYSDGLNKHEGRLTHKKLSKLDFGSLTEPNSPTLSTESSLNGLLSTSAVHEIRTASSLSSSNKSRCPSLLDRSTEILSFEPELLNLLHSSHSITHQQKRAVENALRSTFDLFQLNVDFDGKTKSLIDTASPSVFKRIQDLFFALSELIQNIANNEHNPANEKQHNELVEAHNETYDTLSPLSSSIHLRRSSSSFAGSPSNKKIRGRKVTEEVVENQSSDESSEFSDDEYTTSRRGSVGVVLRSKYPSGSGITRDRSLGRIVDYTRSDSRNTSNNTRITSKNDSRANSISANYHNKQLQYDNSRRYSSSLLSPTSSDEGSYEDYQKQNRRSKIFLESRSRRGSNKLNEPREHRMSLVGYHKSRHEPRRDDSYIEGFDDDFYPSEDQSFNDMNRSYGVPSPPSPRSTNMSQQIIHHKQQLKKLEAMEKLKQRVSSRTNTMSGYSFDQYDRRGSLMGHHNEVESPIFSDRSKRMFSDNSFEDHYTNASRSRSTRPSSVIGRIKPSYNQSYEEEVYEDKRRSMRF